LSDWIVLDRRAAALCAQSLLLQIITYCTSRQLPDLDLPYRLTAGSQAHRVHALVSALNFVELTVPNAHDFAQVAVGPE